MADSNEVFEKVRDVLVEALGVDDDEVTPDAKLVADLGAESIDFIDINFRLSKAFGIEIEQNELFPDNLLKDPTYVKDGKVTDEGIAALKERLPHVELGELESNRSVDDFANIFTVDTLVKFVESKLEEAGQ